MLMKVILAALFVVFVSAEDEETVIKEEVIDDVVYVSPQPGRNSYLAEHFDNINQYMRAWVKSSAKKDGTDAKYNGEWNLEQAAENALPGDRGLVLKSKARHAAISSKFVKPFVFGAKPLIVQYSVTFQNGQECGGAYLKLLRGHDVDLAQFTDKTPYVIMFGPDKCGNDHKLHFIFQHKNPVTGVITEKHSKRPKEKLEEIFKDKKPHLFTLVVNSDNTFQISVDQNVVNSGSLLEDFTPPVNPPSEIDDPRDIKPSDWDEREKISDPEARKPDDWDEDAPAKISDSSAVKPEGWLEEEPEMIPDPNAEKPDDWDEEMDGEWEAPLITNPSCEGLPGCGEWKPPLIDNPNYKGKWRPPMIDNPNYKGKWKPKKIAYPT